MRGALRLSIIPLACQLILGTAAVQAEPPAPAALQEEIAASRLEVSRAVSLKKLKLNAGLATLHLDDGVLIPASAVGGKTVEMVFLGSGRIEIEPPDAIEAGQLELFTGGTRLDEEFKEAVLVVGLDAAVSSMLRRPAAQPAADLAARGEALYAEWRKRGERQRMNVDRGILLDALQDPLSSGYFASWFRGGELGDFFYFLEPGDREQVTLGHFVPLDATEKEKRKLLKQIAREQRKGRLLGVEEDDLGQWDTWLSSSLRSADGQPMPGAPAFEPKKYTLDVQLAERDLRLSGRARLDLEPVVKGSRAALLTLASDFQVTRVTDAGGKDLFFQRNGGDLTVILPQAPASGEMAPVVVEYSGRPVDKDWNLYTLLDTIGWYPHSGAIDRATYDVTFHWPKGFDLVSSGRRADGGEDSGGRRWERRVLEVPTLGFSFEAGHFKVETVRAGHVEVRFAFGTGSTLTGRGVKEDVMKAVIDSLQFYEEKFGPYPLDDLTVTTASRGFSQGMLGFVTLSDLVLNDLGMWNRLFGLPDRRLVAAHEIAHQWWGNQVGWTSYRDQWISEAMASYAALLFGRERLGNSLSGVDLTEGWQNDLTAILADGRPLESVGPVVLGSRLFSSRSDDAYQAIVYKKGAVVLDMLARSLGEESFPKVLKQIVKVAGQGTISTEDFFSLIERITTADLKGFAGQFVFGTGLPEVLYNYRFEKQSGGWVVKGEARQQTPNRYRYKAVKTPRGTFDVAREAVQQLDVGQSALVVPVEISVLDPKQDKGKGKDGANATVRGNILVKGELTEFAIDVENEPKTFWLDRKAKVFGRFFDESRHPKRMLAFQGVKAAAAGKMDEAAAFYERALGTEEPPPEVGEVFGYQDVQWLRRVMNARIELARARLFLEQGKDEEAEDALDKAQRMFKNDEEFKLLQARLDVRRGDYPKAFQRLRKGLKTGDLYSSEGYVLLAIAARETGHAEEFQKALKKARESGADVDTLAGA
ncbi:MAG TPA: M1 family aminopeptidase [Thermoanaerobaculia bacterium]|nr:M1 family aminopeptidase [Thermoanaerobaculia bacterium]